MKLNGTRLEKRSLRKITKFQPRNGGQIGEKTTLHLIVHGPDQISVPNRGTKRECYQLIVLPEVF